MWPPGQQEEVRCVQTPSPGWKHPAKMRANTHATGSLVDIPGDPQTMITIIPSFKIGLRIDQTDITSKYAMHLRKAAMKAVMMTRFRANTRGGTYKGH